MKELALFFIVLSFVSVGKSQEPEKAPRQESSIKSMKLILDFLPTISALKSMDVDSIVNLTYAESVTFNVIFKRNDGGNTARCELYLNVEADENGKQVVTIPEAQAHPSYNPACSLN